MQKFLKNLSKIIIFMAIFMFTDSYAENRSYIRDAFDFARQFEFSGIPPSFDCNNDNITYDQNVICCTPYGLPTFDNFFHSYMTFIMEKIDDADKKHIIAIKDKMYIARADCFYQDTSSKLHGGALEACMDAVVGKGISNLSNFLLSYGNGKYKKYYNQIFEKLSTKEIDNLFEFPAQVELYGDYGLIDLDGCLKINHDWSHVLNIYLSQFKDNMLPPSHSCKEAISTYNKVICSDIYKLPESDKYELPALDNLYNTYYMFVIRSIGIDGRPTIAKMKYNMVQVRNKCANDTKCIKDNYITSIRDIGDFLLTYENGKYSQYYTDIFGNIDLAEIYANFGAKTTLNKLLSETVINMDGTLAATKAGATRNIGILLKNDKAYAIKEYLSKLPDNKLLPSFSCSEPLSPDKKLICNDQYELASLDHIYNRYVRYAYIKAVDHVDYQEIQKLTEDVYQARSGCTKHENYVGLDSPKECIYYTYVDGVYNILEFLRTYENGKYFAEYKSLVLLNDKFKIVSAWRYNKEMIYEDLFGGITNMFNLLPLSPETKEQEEIWKDSVNEYLQQFVEGRLTPSFDCKKATTAGEQMICQNSYQLPALDNMLNSAYKFAMESVKKNERQKLIDISRNIITQRDSCTAKVASEEFKMMCMVYAYQEGIKKLLYFPFSDTVSKTGKYPYTHYYAFIPNNIKFSIDNSNNFIFDMYSAGLINLDGALKVVSPRAKTIDDVKQLQK